MRGSLGRGSVLGGVVAAVIGSGLVAVPVAADGEPDVGDIGRFAHGTQKSAARPSPARRAVDAAADGAVRRSVRFTDTGPYPVSDGHLLSAAEVVQDLRGGLVRTTATFRGGPEPTVVYTYLGVWDGDTCAAQFGSAGATDGSADGTFLDGATQTRSVTTTATLDGTSLSVQSGPDAVFGTAEWECAYAVVASTDATTVYQSLNALSLDTTYAPVLGIDRGEPVQGNYRGRWTKVRLEVDNTGRAAAPNTVVRARGKGLKIKPRSRSLGTLDDRSTEYGVVFRVKLKGKKKARTLKLSATSGSHRATAKVKIAERPRPKPYRSLAGRYFWGHLPASATKGWDNRAVWFVDKKWAYLGFPKAGKKPHCRKKTKKCKRYTYQQRNGVARIGGKKVRIDTEGFRLARATFYPLTLPRKGQRFAVTLMRNDFDGFCGIYCTTSTEWLSMARNGRFVRSKQTIASMGSPGVGTTWASVGADEKGTYRVVGKGRIRFSYADGHTVTSMIGIEHDVRGKPSPAGAGLVVDDANFYLG